MSRFARRIACIARWAATAAVAACGREGTRLGPPVPHAPAPGRLVLSYAEGLRAPAPAGQAPASSGGLAFDLGPIRNTRSFYFLLRNTGGTSITGLTIVQSSPYFEISPVTMDSLPPDSSAEAGVLPVLQLTAVHGTAPSGVGFAPLMPMGTDSTSISINGVTTDTSGDSLAVTLHAVVTVTALVMDIRLFDGTREIDLTRPVSYFTALQDAPDAVVPFFRLDSATITYQNTGNVPIQVAVWPGPCVGYPLEAPLHTLAVGALDTMPMDSAPCVAQPDGLVALDGSGTITDQLRLPQARSGRAYVYIQHR